MTNLNDQRRDAFCATGPSSLTTEDYDGSGPVQNDDDEDLIGDVRAIQMAAYGLAIVTALLLLGSAVLVVCWPQSDPQTQTEDRPASVTQADLERALKAAADAGL